jgi:hypothetical protein
MHRKWSFPIVWALSGPPSAARDAIASHYARTEAFTADDVAAIVTALDVLGARRAAEAAWSEQSAGAERIAAHHRLDRAAAIEALFRGGPATAMSAVR